MAAHSYWRLNVSANNGHTYLAINKLQIRAVAGGADQCTGGTPSASTSYPGSYGPQYAFDASTVSYWCANANTGWLAYQFASPVDCVEYVVTSEEVNNQTDTPKNWTLEWSDDGTNWTVADTRYNQCGWGNSEARVYRVGVYCAYRLNITANNGYAGGALVAELEIRASVGGATQCTGGAPVASSQSVGGTYAALKAFDGVVTGSGTSWYAKDNTYPQWLGYHFPTAFTCLQYAITGHYLDPSMNPKSWTLEKSTDGGNTWTVVDTQSGVVFAAGEVKTFNVIAGTTRTISNAGGNWNSPATWVEGVVPTAGTDVVATPTSGNVTITADAYCRSLDLTGYTGSLTHNAAMYLYVGDASGGAFRLSTGMTYTPLSVNAHIYLVATSDNGGAGWPVDPCGKALCSIHFGNTVTGGKWVLQGDLTVSSSNPGVYHGAGTLDLNGKNVTAAAFSDASSSATRVLNLTNSVITLSGSSTAWNINGSNITLNAGTSVIKLTYLGTAEVIFNGGGKTYNEVQLLSGYKSSIKGVNTFVSLKKLLTGGIDPAWRTDKLMLYANQTVTGTLTLTGAGGAASPKARLLVCSDTPGAQRTISAPVVAASYTDFQDINGTGGGWDLSAATGGSGNCHGNAGITFTPAATMYWYSAVAGNFSDASRWFLGSGGTGGAGRTPLPQDTLIVNAASGPVDISLDMPRMGTVDLSAVTSAANAPCKVTFAMGANTYYSYIYGSFIAAPDVRYPSGSSYGYISLEGRGNYVFSPYCVYTAGVTTTQYFNTMQVNAPGGTYTLGSNLAMGGDLKILRGTLNGGGFNVLNCGSLDTGTNVADARGLNLGTGTWYVSQIYFSATLLTFTGGSSTIVLKSDSFVQYMAGLTFGTLNINATNSTFNSGFTVGNLSIAAGKTVIFGGNSTVTVTGTITATGTAGNLITIRSPVNGTKFTLSKASGTVSCDYISLRDSAATGGASWYAGANSTNVSGNTGWNFTAAPPPGATANETVAEAATLTDTVTAVVTAAPKIDTAAETATLTDTVTGTVVPAPVTRTISPAGGNWNSPTTWVEGIVPTAANDVVATASSGNLTVNVKAYCRSLDLTGYTGTLTHNAFELHVGNASGGAFKLSPGMTYIYSSAFNSMLYLDATSDNGGAGWPIATCGKAMPRTVFYGAGGKWVLTDDFTQTSGSAGILLQGGYLDLNGKAVSTGYLMDSGSSTPRTLNMGASTVTVSGTTYASSFTGTNQTVIVTTGKILFTNTGGVQTFGAGVHVFNYEVAASAYVNFTGNMTFGNVLLQPKADVQFDDGKTITLAGTFTANGTPGNMIRIEANTGATLSKASGTVSGDYLTIVRVSAAGGAAFYAGTHSTNYSGIATGWVFTDPPPVTHYDVVAADDLAFSDALVLAGGVNRYYQDLADSLDLSETQAVAGGIKRYYHDLADALALSDTGAALAVPNRYTEALSDALSLILDIATSAVALSGVYVKTLAETLGAGDVLLHSRGFTAADQFTAGAEIVGDVGRLAADYLRLDALLTPTGTRHTVLVERLLALDDPRKVVAVLRLVAETADFAETLPHPSVGARLAEILGLPDRGVAQWKGSLMLAELLTLLESGGHGKGYGEILLELVQLAAEPLALFTVALAAAEEMALDAAPAADRIGEGALSEALILTEGAGSGGALQGYLADTMRFTFTVRLSGETYQAWSFASDAFLPSLYTGFAFNSFVATPDGRAFGAAEAGIYLMGGEDDDGRKIERGVRLNYFTFGTHLLKSLHLAFFGLAGGKPVLKVIADGGAIQYYVVEGRAKLAHGVKAREWELVLADIDALDFVELSPIVLSR